MGKVLKYTFWYYIIYMPNMQEVFVEFLTISRKNAIFFFCEKSCQNAQKTNEKKEKLFSKSSWQTEKGVVE